MTILTFLSNSLQTHYKPSNVNLLECKEQVLRWRKTLNGGWYKFLYTFHPVSYNRISFILGKVQTSNWNSWERQISTILVSDNKQVTTAYKHIYICKRRKVILKEVPMQGENITQHPCTLACWNNILSFILSDYGDLS